MVDRPRLMQVVTQSGVITPVLVTASGKLESSLALGSGDFQIGAVEIKDGTTNVRAIVTASGAVKTDSTSSIDIEGGGKVAVTSAASEITFTGTTKSIIITADKDNTQDIYIGESNVTNAGANALTFLSAGDTLTLDYNDTSNALYIVSATGSQNYWKGATL